MIHVALTIFLFRFATSHTLHGAWDMLDLLCVGDMLDDEERTLCVNCRGEQRPRS
jgi:hypothetical protein